MVKYDKGVDMCGGIWMVVKCSVWMRRDVDEWGRMTNVWCVPSFNFFKYVYTLNNYSECTAIDYCTCTGATFLYKSYLDFHMISPATHSNPY